MFRATIALAVFAVMGSPAPQFPSVQYNLATIENSGSTNRAGFRIAMRRSGSAEYSVIPRGANASAAQAEPVKREIPAELMKRLFADLEAARPLASLPAPHCMKSASFGTRLTVQFGTETTPDLSCGDGGNEHLRALIRDVREVIAEFTGNQP
jgi:hypothetical protein